MRLRVQPCPGGVTQDTKRERAHATTAVTVWYTPSDTVQPTARGGFGEQHWQRLVALKRRYDPENVFRLNANVPPPG